MHETLTGSGQINDWINNSLEALYECGYSDVKVDRVFNQITANSDGRSISLKFIKTDDYFVKIEIEGDTEEEIQKYKNVASSLFKKEINTKKENIEEKTESTGDVELQKKSYEQKKEKNSLKTATVIGAVIASFFIILIILSVVGNSMSSKPSPKPSTSTANSSPTPSNSTEPSPTATPDPTPSLTVYEPGTYKVGIDLPAGEYFIIGPGYVGVYADSSGNSIIDNDNLDLCGYVGVNDGEYLKLSRCKAIPESETVPLDVEKYRDGVFKVGKDIPAGEYKITADGSSGYYERNAAPIGANEDIIANDNFEGSTYITINDGEYLKLSRCVLVK